MNWEVYWVMFTVTALRAKAKLQEVIAVDHSTRTERHWHPGLVVTDARFQTSVPGVFAAGDVRGGSTKQLGSAVGEGIATLLMIRRTSRSTTTSRR